jgi:iron complex outermembrane receptor protein
MATPFHAHPFPAPRRRPLALACALALSAWTPLAAAQSGAAAPAVLPEVRVLARPFPPATETATVGGLSSAPLAETPMSISVIRAGTLRDVGAGGLSGAIRGEPSVGDAYNAIGYIESLQVRGFLLDNAQNYRREGLPVSNHTPMAFENKEAIEILRGTSGIQAGTSAPGGLLNQVLKRPTAAPLREVFFGLSERGSALLHADLGGRAGPDEVLGYRVNVSAEERRLEVRDAPGNRRFASVFLDLRLPDRSVLEIEGEQHRYSQVSVPGYGLLDRNGDGVAETLPGLIDPRRNLNNQPWSQPFESRASAASIAWRKALSDNWQLALRHAWQEIRTNDRLAFPDGCSSGPVYVYPGLCGNGDVDIYDYRSDGERRVNRNSEAVLRGKAVTGAIRHELTLGLLDAEYSERYQPRQAYNWVGTSNIHTPVVLPADPVPGDLNTLRDSRSREFWVADAMRLPGGWSVWGGARHSELSRGSQRTDGSRALSYDQSLTTGWGAIGWQPWTGGMAYVSAGTGVESEAVPNRPSLFSNAGAVLPALRSRQAEAGFKQVLPSGGLFSVALFEIVKPFSGDLPDASGTPSREAGAREARHRGVELAWSGRPLRSLWLQAQATLLDAEITRSPDATEAGKRPTNVAPAAASVLAAWQVPGVDGLQWINRLALSGRKAVTRDNTVSIPGYAQWDTALNWRLRADGRSFLWRVGIDNVLDKRYWREAPTQYWGGTYLFPAYPRTFRASVQIGF